MTAPISPLQLPLPAVYDTRDKALAMVEEAGDDWDRACIDQVLREMASRRTPFSANDVRPLLGGVRPALIGARFRAAAVRGEIRKVGYVTSTDPGTHSHPVAQWVGVA